MDEDTRDGLILIGLIGLAVFLAISFSRTDTLAQKCAETQGRYDFCVQKISYEVKK